MAATTAGSLKALIESLGLGLAAYRDEAPPEHARPYVSISEDVSAVPDKSGDNALGTGTELVQVDLWQQWRDPTSLASTENTALIGPLVAGLHGASIASIGTKRVYSLFVRNVRRLLEIDNNIVHHAIDVDVKREM